MRIGLLLTGSELVDGRLQDGNSQTLAQMLSEYGLQIHRSVTCDDDIDAIIDSLKILTDRCELVFTSGGLGPTTGDRTREALAKFLGVDLEIDLPSLEKIKTFFSKRNRPFEENNTKQALKPKGAKMLENDWGVAPGLEIKYKNSLIFSLPGVPSEFSNLLIHRIFPSCFHASGRHPLPSRLLRTFGLGESYVSARVQEASIPEGIKVAYRASFPEVQVVLRAEDSSQDEETLSDIARKVANSIGNQYLFSTNHEHHLSTVVHELLIKNRETVAVAESCTAGYLGYLFTKEAGSSQYFLGGILTYSNQSKSENLGIPASLIETAGAVSAEVAKEMATNVQRKFKSTYGLSITGIAGPDGGTEAKPVGLVYLGFATAYDSQAVKIFFPSGRLRVRQYAATAALELLRRKLLKIDLSVPFQTT